MTTRQFNSFFKVLEIRNNRKNDSFTATSAWDSQTSSSAWPVENNAVIEPTKPALPTSFAAGYTRFKAVYEFYARNNDEITFQPGDIIMVKLTKLALLFTKKLPL